MLLLRTVLSIGMVLIGAIIVVRMFSTGFSLAIVPGIVLGAAIMALGLYRLKQLRNLRDKR